MGIGNGDRLTWDSQKLDKMPFLRVFERAGISSDLRHSARGVGKCIATMFRGGDTSHAGVHRILYKNRNEYLCARRNLVYRSDNGGNGRCWRIYHTLLTLLCYELFDILA